MLRVALLVQSRSLREALRALLSTSDRMQAARYADEAPDPGSLTPVDAIVCDDSQLELARQAHEDGVPVILLTDENEPAASLPMRGSGFAVLPTSADSDQILAAVEAASLGLSVMHADLLGREESSPGTALDADLSEALTPRELEVLLTLAAGLGNKGIGTRLGISEHTVKFHVSQILAKLRVSSRAEAVSVGLRRGLLPL